MKKKATYHAHTVFCDGNNTVEEMIQNAITKGFTDIGFSAHALYPFASTWHMPLRSYMSYCTEVRSLGEKYKKDINVYLGFEADYFIPLSRPSYAQYKDFSIDYIIGSVHYLFIDETLPCFTADGSASEVSQGIQEVFASNARLAVERYFACQRAMIASCDFDVVGHIDVIRKRNGELHFFDEKDTWYKNEIEKTADIAASCGKIVEINTGGIARGAIDDVYPSHDFLRALHKRNVPIVINSDSHSIETLDTAYEQAYESAKRAGYSSSLYFEDGCWKEYSF